MILLGVKCNDSSKRLNIDPNLITPAYRKATAVTVTTDQTTPTTSTVGSTAQSQTMPSITTTQTSSAATPSVSIVQSQTTPTTTVQGQLSAQPSSAATPFAGTSSVTIATPSQLNLSANVAANIPTGLIPVNILTMPNPSDGTVSVRWGRILKGQHKYFCPDCKQGFTKTGDVKVHQRDSCLNKGKKLYSSTFPNCTKSYAKQQSLKDHQAKFHLNITRYSCQYCNEKFATNYEVVTHRKLCQSWFFSASLQTLSQSVDALNKDLHKDKYNNKDDDNQDPFPLIQ